MTGLVPITRVQTHRVQIDARSEAERSELSGRVREVRVETQIILVASQHYATSGSDWAGPGAPRSLDRSLCWV